MTTPKQEDAKRRIGRLWLLAALVSALVLGLVGYAVVSVTLQANDLEDQQAALADQQADLDAQAADLADQQAAIEAQAGENAKAREFLCAQQSNLKTSLKASAGFDYERLAERLDLPVALLTAQRARDVATVETGDRTLDCPSGGD